VLPGVVVMDLKLPGVDGIATMRDLRTATSSPSGELAAGCGNLTEAEEEMLALLAQGLSIERLAAQQEVTLGMVRQLVQHLNSRCRVKTRTELVAHATHRRPLGQSRSVLERPRRPAASTRGE
jgi:DNA-binding NarL/FixJ family response regulator